MFENILNNFQASQSTPAAPQASVASGSSSSKVQTTLANKAQLGNAGSLAQDMTSREVTTYESYMALLVAKHVLNKKEFTVLQGASGLYFPHPVFAFSALGRDRTPKNQREFLVQGLKNLIQDKSIPQESRFFAAFILLSVGLRIKQLPAEAEILEAMNVSSKNDLMALDAPVSKIMINTLLELGHGASLRPKAYLLLNLKNVATAIEAHDDNNSSSSSTLDTEIPISLDEKQSQQVNEKIDYDSLGSDSQVTGAACNSTDLDGHEGVSAEDAILFDELMEKLESQNITKEQIAASGLWSYWDTLLAAMDTVVNSVSAAASYLNPWSYSWGSSP